MLRDLILQSHNFQLLDGDPPLEGIFNILYYILVEGRYCKMKASHKWYYDEWKQSYFEGWSNFQYLMEKTAVSIKRYKKTFYLNYFIGKRILQ